MPKVTWRTPVLQSRVLSLRDGTWLPYHAGSQDQNSGIRLSAQLHLVRVGEKESPHCTWGNDGQSPLPQRLSPSPQPCLGSVTFSQQRTVRACRMPGTATDSEKAAVTMTETDTDLLAPWGSQSHLLLWSLRPPTTLPLRPSETPGDTQGPWQLWACGPGPPICVRPILTFEVISK